MAPRIESQEDIEEMLSIAGALYLNFQHPDVRLGIAALAGALLFPDIDLDFMGDDPIVKVTDLAIRGHLSGTAAWNTVID